MSGGARRKKSGKRRKSTRKQRSFNNAAHRPGQPAVPPGRLAAAVDAGDFLAVKALLARGADPNEKTTYGAPALYAALQSPDMMIMLINAGADVDAKTSHGDTALIQAALCGYTEAAALLIEKGASLDELGSNSHYTPLMWSAHWSYPAVTKLLIEAGADPDIQNERGDTALHIASGSHGRINVPEEETNRIAREVLRHLLSGGANADIKDKDGETPLIHSAIWCKDPEAIAMLAEKTKDINAQDKNGNTALIHAAGTRPVAKLRAILEAHPDINISNRNGDTALIEVGNHACMIIGWDTRVDEETGEVMRSNRHFTPEVRQSIIESGLLLIERGADIHRQNEEGKTALSILAETDCADIAQIFREAYLLRQQRLAAAKRQEVLRTQKQPPRFKP